MAKYLVETYYTCTFKVNHYLDDINETELKNLEKRDDGKFDEIDASKIPTDWYSWIHHTPNVLENNQNPNKFTWQKPHKPNLTGTKEAYYPNKDKDEPEKKYKSWLN